MTKIVGLIVVLCLLLATSSGCTQFPQPNELSDPYTVISHYGALGDHRSGTIQDIETSTWLERRLGQLGVPVELQTWPVDVFDLTDNSLEVGGEHFESFPFWYPQATPSSGVNGPMKIASRADHEGSIVLYRTEPGRYEMHFDVAPWLEDAASAGALAAIVIIDHPRGSVSAQNAVKPWHQCALPLPAVIASTQDAERLLALESQGSTATLVISGKTTKRYGVNVIGRIDRGAGTWIVISTPTSGWFAATNERGPGIAAWLELATWAVAEERSANYLFVAMSGHELDKMGMRALVASRILPDPTDVPLWVHLGSGIAVTQPVLTAVSSSRSLQEDVYETLVAPFGRQYFPEEAIPKGSEQFVAHELGYPVAGLFGANNLIHTRDDRIAEIDLRRYKETLKQIKILIKRRLAAFSKTDT